MSRHSEASDEVQTWEGSLNYKEGFFTQLQTDELAHGINEDVVRAISAKRNEPEWCSVVDVVRIDSRHGHFRQDPSGGRMAGH